MSDIKKVIGNNLRYIRYQSGLSQEKFYEKYHLSVKYLSSIERGEINIGVELLEQRRDNQYPVAKTGNGAGINFHIGMPGIKEENGMLLMNKQYDNAEIRYTTDGSEPTAQSTLWTEPVKATGKVVKAKMFYLGKESKTTRLDR